MHQIADPIKITRQLKDSSTNGWVTLRFLSEIAATTWTITIISNIEVDIDMLVPATLSSLFSLKTKSIFIKVKWNIAIMVPNVSFCQVSFKKDWKFLVIQEFKSEMEAAMEMEYTQQKFQNMLNFTQSLIKKEVNTFRSFYFYDKIWIRLSVRELLTYTENFLEV